MDTLKIYNELKTTISEDAAKKIAEILGKDSYGFIKYFWIWTCR